MAQLEREHPFEAEPPVPNPEAAFDGWVLHSRDLAREVVYRRGALRPATARETAPVLRRDYIEQARAVGAEQIALAGNRIGALLGGLR